MPTPSLCRAYDRTIIILFSFRCEGGLVVRGFEASQALTSARTARKICGMGLKITNTMATILIIEERPVNRRFLVTLLQDHGHRLLEAEDGTEGLKIVRAEKPDLVLIDILTPNVDGCQFVLNLRSEPSLAQPRVVFRAAAYIEAEARVLANAFGASFVAKPASPETLLASIDALLRPIAKKVHRHTAILEIQNAELDRAITERDAQLEVARSAVDQEIKKRLWAEQELTRANLRLQDQAMHDGLTGLYNRRYLEESLSREESRARRSSQSFGVMMIDIDNFKRFNDTLGHAAGDVVLRALGQYMLSVARGEDIVSRYGGEEFVLVMAQAPQGTVWERAAKLRRGVQELEIEYEGQRVGPITISVGIGIFPEHGESGQALLRVADTALYAAKQSGRNRVVVGDRAKA